MNNPKNNRKYTTYIVDDEEYSIDLLTQELLTLPRINIIGTETHYSRALKAIKEHKPDLIFLDVEMPCKSGFELLHDVRKQVDFDFHVIFYTAYDRYAIQALRESAFDFILKPVQRDELKTAIERLSNQEKQTGTKNWKENKLFPGPGDVITIPTYTGIRFLKCNEIVVIKYRKEKDHRKGNWIIYLHNHEELRLRTGLNSKRLLELLGNNNFVQINQASIVNVNYINVVEIKTKQCYLLPPFDKVNLMISRNCMNHIRERFEYI